MIHRLEPTKTNKTHRILGDNGEAVGCAQEEALMAGFSATPSNKNRYNFGLYVVEWDVVKPISFGAYWVPPQRCSIYKVYILLSGKQPTWNDEQHIHAANKKSAVYSCPMVYALCDGYTCIQFICDQYKSPGKYNFFLTFGTCEFDMLITWQHHFTNTCIWGFHEIHDTRYHLGRHPQWKQPFHIRCEKQFQMWYIYINAHLSRLKQVFKYDEFTCMQIYFTCDIWIPLMLFSAS